MSTAVRTRADARPDAGPDIPPLESGDRLSRPEFERRYHAMGPGVRAELVEGVVYVASPVSRGHGSWHFTLGGCLFVYVGATPGVEGLADGTVRLDLDNEPQPDVMLRIRPDHGGRSATSEDDYVEGAPELVIEVAASSASYDLHDKFRAYQRNGVLEYLIWRVRDRALDWFVHRDGRFVRHEPDAAGVFRSECFPGLWLDSDALVRKDGATLLRVMQEGLASPEHAAFVERLRAQAARIAAQAPAPIPPAPPQEPRP